MKTITVQVREDHLETLSRTKPMTALAELVWNALDAEAMEVRVEFEENALGGIERLRVVDNGHGLHYDDAFLVFRNLGGSWKRANRRTMGRRRALHGKYGKGRFRAFSLGNRVAWHTVYRDGPDAYAFSIGGDAARLGEFNIEDRRGKPGAATGMVVEIAEVPDTTGLLRGVKAVEEFTNIFALYLRQYPDTRLFYDGIPVDPANAETGQVTYPLEEMVMENGERVSAEITVVEWARPGRRGVFLCDADGFMRLNALPRLHFRGFSYTAYLKSAHVETLDREGMLEAGELCADVRQLLDAARARLREHFALREAEDAADLLEYWRRTGLYPYEAPPRNDSERNERRIFDIYATHLNRIFSDFSESRPRAKRLTLRLIQELVRLEPIRMARILDELLQFPEESEEEIMEIVGNA
ncbi:MAG: ATP-binding protein [Candidatus Hydrogenedentes bacterium]|nr:ATP-binding protein [Candidatus Hydrogenedentota bacterium]